MRLPQRFQIFAILFALLSIEITLHSAVVTNVTSLTPDGSYRSPQQINVQVWFNEPVFVTGNPRVQLETGVSDRFATFTFVSGSTMNFSYTINAGDTSFDLNYQFTNSLQLNGGTIKNGALVDAILTLPPLNSPSSLAGNKDIIIDTFPPAIVSVTSVVPNAVYGTGSLLPIQVVFAEPVVVVGTPRLVLETGSTDRTNNYTSGSGTGILRFDYSVQSGDSSADLDYTSSTALSQNAGSSITDMAGNNAVITLPAPGLTGSLGANKNFTIVPTNHAAMPTVVLSSPTLTFTNVNGLGFVNLTYNATVTPNNAATIIAFEFGSTTNYGSLFVTNIGNGNTPVSVTNSAGGLVPNLTYNYRTVASNSIGVVTSTNSTLTFTNRAPTLSDFTSQGVPQNTSTPSIAFTVSDTESPATNLAVTAFAANTNLVPAQNISISGTTGSRSLTITPASNQSGRTTITIVASDGAASTARSFILSVGVEPADSNADGTISDPEINSALSSYWNQSPLYLTNPATLGSGIFELSLTNLLGWNLDVQVSTNLVDWTNLTTSASPTYQFLDPEATNAPVRFYRLR